MGWEILNGRDWNVQNDKLTTLTPSTNAKQPVWDKGLIISKYPCGDNGTFSADIVADQWNGDMGGMILRWSSPQSYCFVSVKPGWTNSGTIYFSKNSMEVSSKNIVAQNINIPSSFNLKVQTNGSTFSIYINDIFCANVIDADHPFGQVGFGYGNQWNNYFSVDNCKWIDTPGSIRSKDVDPSQGKTDLRVYIIDNAYYQSNMLQPRIIVENVGQTRVTNFDVCYFFTAENGKVPQLMDHYTPESDAQLINLGNNDYCVQYHFDKIILAPGEITPDPNGNAVSIYYEDWSPFNKTNDYSNPGTSAKILTTKIAVYGNFPKNNDFIIDNNETKEDPYTVISGDEPPRMVAAGVALATADSLAAEAATETYKKVTITRVRCSTQQEYTGKDDIYIEVKLDDNCIAKKMGPKRMESRSDWYIPSTESDKLYFTSYAKIRLMEEDYDSPDDQLEEFTLDMTDGDHTRRKRTSDYDYTIYYTISTITKRTTGNFRKCKIDRIHCTETESNFTEDKLYVDFRLDSDQIGKTIGIHRMNNGDDWYPSTDENKDLIFQQYTQIDLTDADNFFPSDNDDHIGTLRVSPIDGSFSKLVIGDDARYRVDYTVTTVDAGFDINDPFIPVIGAVPAYMLQNFIADQAVGIWKHINKADLIGDLKSKLRDPSAVDQCELKICGPAGLTYELAKTNPFKFVASIRDLYTTGTAKMRTATYKTSESLRKCKIKSSIKSAEWILMMTIQSRLQPVIHCDANEELSSEMDASYYWDMVDWIEEILGGDNVGTDFALLDEDEVMDAAMNAVNKHGHAFLGIDGDLLKGYFTKGSLYPNHWVPLIGDYEYTYGDWYSWDSGHYKFKCYSWGKEYSVDVDENTLEDFLWGAVYTDYSFF
jgi:hypothetical protein